MRRPQWSHRAVFVLSALAVGIIIGGYFAYRLLEISRHLDRLLASQLESQLGRAVASGSVRISRDGRFSIQEIKIADGPTFKSGVFFQADRIDGKLDLVSLALFKKSPIQAIRSAAIRRPRLMIRRNRDGHWNFEGLLKPRKVAGPSVAFEGTAQILDGMLEVRDDRALFPKRELPATNRLISMSGEADGRKPGEIRFRLSGRGEGFGNGGGRFASAEVSGIYRYVAKAGAVKASISSLDAPYWIRYFSLPAKDYRLASGSVDFAGEINFAKGKLDLASLKATAAMRQGLLASRFLKEPLRFSSVQARARGESIQATAAANWANIPVTASGRLSGFSHSILDARGTVGAFAVERLPRLLAVLPADRWPGVTGMASLTARLYGPIRDLKAQAHLVSAELSRQGATARGADAVATLDHGLVRGSLSLRRMLEGDLRASGEWRLDDPKHPWKTEGTFERISLASLPAVPMKLTGAATGSFRLSGFGSSYSGEGDLALPEGSAGPLHFYGGRGSLRTSGGETSIRATMDRGVTPGGRFRSLVAEATADRSGWTLASARAEAWRGVLRASGRIAREGALNLKLNADRVSLKEALSAMNLDGYSGTAAFDGRLTGAIRSPLLTGRLSARDGALSGVAYSSLTGDIRASQAGFALRNGVLRTKGGSLSMSGDAGLAKTGRISVSMTGGFKDFDLGQISRLDFGPNRRLTLPPDLRGGALSGQIRVTGAYPNLILAFSPFHLVLPDGDARLEGTLAFGKTGIRTRFSAMLDRIPAALIQRTEWNDEPIFKLPYMLQQTKITGGATLSGPVNQIVGDAQALLSPILVPAPGGGALVADRAEGHAHLSGRTLSLDNVVVHAYGETMTGGGELTLGGPLRIELTGRDISLKPLSPYFQTFMRASGHGDATVVASGEAGHLSVEVRAETGPIVADGARFDKMSGTFRWDGHRIAFEDVRLQRADGILSLPSGWADLKDREMDLTLQAYHFDASALFQALEGSPYMRTAGAQTFRQFLSEFPIPRQGFIDGELTVLGPMDDWEIRTRLSGEMISLGTARFSRVSLDGTWSRGNIDLRSLYADASDFHLYAQGIYSQDRPIDFTVHLGGTEMQSLVQIFDAIPALRRANFGREALRAVTTFRTPVSGKLDAYLSVTGSEEEPQGQLAFSVADLTLGPQRFTTTEGLLAIQGKRFYVRRLDMQGDEVVVNASGYGGLGGELSFDLNVYNLNIQTLAPAFGLPRDLTGTIDVLSVQISGTQEHPVLQASIDARTVGTERYQADTLRAYGIRADGDRLTIERIVATQKPPGLKGVTLQATAGGYLPFRFNPVGIPKDGTLDFHADVERQSLSLLTAFTPEVEAADGTFGGSMRITGTVARPVATGSFDFQEGEIKLARLRNRFTHLTGSLDLADNVATLKGVKGESDLGGSFALTGTASLLRFPQGELKIALATQDLALSGNNSSQIYGEQFTGRLDSSISLAGKLTKPIASGTMTIRQADVTLPETPPTVSPTAPPFLPINLAFDGLRIEGRSIFARRGGFQGDIAGGLTIDGSFQEPRINGRLSMTNARARVATKLFRIQDGSSISVAYQPSDAVSRVGLDMEATTRLSYYSDVEQQPQSYQVTVAITGTMDNPSLDFSSDPPDLDRQQILAALGYQSQLQAILQGGQGSDKAFRQGLAEAFSGVVAPTLFEPLEYAVMRAFGLEDFALMYDPSMPLQVQATKQLTGKFYASYQRQLASENPTYLFKLYYRLTPRINLGYSLDERHAQTWSVEGRVRF